MQTLPQIASAHQQLADELQAEIQDALNIEDLGEMQTRLESIAQTELHIRDALTDKVNAWCWVIRRLIATSEYFRSQAKYFQKLAQRTDNAVESMQLYLLHTLEDTNNPKLKTKDFNLSVCRASSVPLVIDNEYAGDIPDEFLKARDIEDMVDKTAVKEALRAGKPVPFAKLGQASKYIRGLK